MGGLNLADGTPLLLQQLEPPLTTILLSDSALPEAGVPVDSVLRATRTHYPGNSSPSVQVMGTEEQPIPFKGWFKDVWLGEIGGAALRATDLRTLYLGQARVQLMWGTLLVRRGHITRCRLVWHTEADVEYEIEFTPDDSDEPLILAAIPAEIPDAAALASLLAAVAAALPDLSAILAVQNAVKALV